MKYIRIINKPDRSFFLFGPRASGKSTWLRTEAPDAPYVDLLDEALYQRYLSQPELFSNWLNALPPKSKIVIDEIQRLPSLLNEVHRFIEQKHLSFVLSGSSARKLRKVGTNLLAGRAVRRELFPFVPEELGADFDLDFVLAHGSLPIVLAAGGDREVLEG